MNKTKALINDIRIKIDRKYTAITEETLAENNFVNEQFNIVLRELEGIRKGRHAAAENICKKFALRYNL